MSERRSLSRRELFSRLFESAQHCVESARTVPTGMTKAATKSDPRFAVVQGRFCLAYQRSFCSTCVERCPVAGAVQVENGVPRINADLCDGCGICHEVCPAPRNAILMLPRQRIPALRK